MSFKPYKGSVSNLRFRLSGMYQKKSFKPYKGSVSNGQIADIHLILFSFQTL